jgi:hypothetical protein
MQTVIAAAGTNAFPRGNYRGWYPDLGDEARFGLLALMQQQISIEEYQDTVQQMADDVKADDSIPKFTREA